MKAWMQPLEEIAGYQELKRTLRKKEGILEISGCLDAQKAHLAAGLTEVCSAVLFVAENERKARDLYEDYRLFDPEVLYYPRRDLIFYQADLSGNEITKQRMQVFRALIERKKVAVITSTGGCMDYLLPVRVLRKAVRVLRSDSVLDLEAFCRDLVRLGYERCAEVEAPGQFAVRGGILDLFSLTEDNPWRIELFDNEVDSIRSFDVESQRSIENLQEICIFPATEEIGREDDGENPEKFYRQLTDTLPDYLPEGHCIFLDEPGRILTRAGEIYAEYREAMKHRMESGQIRAFAANRMITEEELRCRFERDNCVSLSLLPLRRGLLCVSGQMEVTVHAANTYNQQFPELVKDMRHWKKEGWRVILLSASRTRGRRLAEELRNESVPAFYSEEEDRELQPGEVMVTCGSIRKGFSYPLQKFVLITESDIFGAERKKRKARSKQTGEKIRSFSELTPGDYVVHEDHGLGIYRGLEKVEVDHVVKEFLRIEYAGGSSLYIQTTQMDRLQKYAGADSRQPRINKLGGQEWNKTKTRVKAAVRDMARELVQLYAARMHGKGFAFGPDTVWQKEFEELFPFEETEDQLQAIEETKRDMESERIMDRLICGDVGYGKTEIAIRAAFKAVQDNKQVVLLVPTTLLAQQHYQTFRQRMKDYPVRVDVLSRFRTAAQQKKTLEDLRKGYVDILIGTHRVLSKDVRFKDLGLLIVDEEQRFGVTHKEKIKHLKENVDVLTLTATPIPRTLHMSLIGIRDMSVLEEAPLDRHPIQTYVMEYDEELVREAISRELSRGGQVYYVHNKISTLPDTARRIQEMLPDARVAYAHGRMNEQQTERVMYDFVNGEIDVLVSTTIIETGLDISNVNTMIIQDADRMGLSQLYQLRGRVGRSNRTAYAFLMYRKNKMLKEDAEKRLHAIREFTELGSGVKIAMRDLEIRGAGNLLGAEQHGHMEAVGYDLYCKMLNAAVQEAKGNPVQEDFETTVDLAVHAYIPENYIKEEWIRLDIYKRIAMVENDKDAEDMLDELTDRFGDPPAAVMNLVGIAAIRAAGHRVYVTEIRQNRETVKVVLFERAELHPERIPDLLGKASSRLQFKAAEKPYFLLRIPEKESAPKQVLHSVGELMHDLEMLL